MLQASEGGRVYLGRSALETSLREAPALGQSGLIPVAMAAIPTERISRPALADLPTTPDVIEKGVLIAKSTLAGLCLTAFACGIITTIAIGHGHAPSVAQVARVQETQPAAAPAVADPAPAEVPAAAAPAPADPLVVQMAGTPAAEPERAVDKAPAHVVAARTPRPPVTRTPPARRRPMTEAPATVADAPAASAPAAKWVDPFAE
ncbi:MAG: hypothetical protein ACJ8F1_24060 [Polyangia bacterium]